MPRFEGFIYGNVPIEGECTIEGEIVNVMVTGLKNHNGHPVYLDYTEEEQYALEIKLARNISEAISDWYRQIRQEKKHGR